MEGNSVMISSSIKSKMDHPKFHKFAILLLISCATTTNATGSGTDDESENRQTSHTNLAIFDNAIRQFVEQFATKLESTSSKGKDQQQQPQLSYNNVAHILKGIEENVVSKVIAAEERKKDVEIGNFHAILGQIGNDILHQEMEWKWGQNANLQHALKSTEPNRRKIMNAQLFHRLLTFAIRMGFHIGQTALNAETWKPKQIDWHKLVRAQIYLEKKHGSEWVKTDLHKVWFKNVPTENLLKLDFNPSNWNEWHITQNMTTIQKLLANSMEVTIEGWLDLVEWIRGFRLNSYYSMNSKVLAELMTSWSGKAEISGRYHVQTIEYCAAKKFAINLIERMNGVEKFKYFLPKNLKAIEESEAKDYDMACTYEKLLANGSNIKDEKVFKANELLMYSTEPFMHYEDAIPIAALKTEKEIEIEHDKTVIHPILAGWRNKFEKCQIAIAIDQKTVSVAGHECDFKHFSAELLDFEQNYEKPSNAAFAVLSMGEEMNLLLDHHRTLMKDLVAANATINAVQNRKKRVWGHLNASEFKAQQRADINAEVAKMKTTFADLKRTMLTGLDAMMDECDGSFSRKSS